ncbi:DUF4097 family beta strand repeat-containing protein [Weissella kandleri]|uniref:DUF4097 family beta strand repeat-containing protein n=1 Tax=Weissella kandleri TaxID=1616 RepID=UPI00387E65C3
MNEKLKQEIEAIFADRENNLALEEFKNEVEADANEAYSDYQVSHPRASEGEVIDHVLSDLGDLDAVIDMIAGEAPNQIYQIDGDEESPRHEDEQQDAQVPDVIQNVDVNVYAGQVFIMQGTGSQVKVEQVFNHEHAELAVVINETPQEYAVTMPRLSGRGLLGLFSATTSNRFKNVIKVELPAHFKGVLNLKLNAGEVFMTDLVLQNQLDITVSAGTLHVNRLEASELMLTLLAGRANLQQVKLQKFFKGTVSAGELHLDQIEAKFDLNVAAGVVTGQRLMGSGHFDVNAGSLSLDWQTVDAQLDLTTALGNIRVGFDAQASYTIQGYSTLGMIRVLRPHQVQSSTANLAAQVGDNPKFKVTAQTSFGNITIR